MINEKYGIDTTWLNIDRPDESLFNPMDFVCKTSDVDATVGRLCYLMSQPEYFYFTCKYILNVEPLPFQLVILQELWNKKYPMLIGSRGTSKSWCMAVYGILRALLIPKRKIVVVGAAFRQSKVIFGYMEDIWHNAPILRDLCDSSSGIVRGVDSFVLNINDSSVTCLPLGNGEKIRGQRANDILSDEFACLRADTLIQTQHGLIEIKDYLDGEAYDLMNENEEFETPDRIFVTPKTDVYEITTRYGYKFYCSEKHKVKSQTGWVLAKDLTVKDRLFIDYNDYFPSDYVNGLDDVTGWLLGLLVSEGTVTNRNFISIINTDRSLIDAIKSRIPFDWKESYREAHQDKRGWDCKEAWSLQHSNTEYRTFLYNLGLGYCIAKEKVIPKKILQSPKSVIIEFLSGMYEGDGSAFTTKTSDGRPPEFQVVLYSSSDKLLKTTQTLLLKFGILSSINDRDGSNYRLVTRGNMASKLFNLLHVLKWKDIQAPEINDARIPQIKHVSETRYRVGTTHGNKNIHLGTFNTREECLIRFNEYWASARELLQVTNVSKLDEQEVLYDFYMPQTNSFIGNGFVQHNSIPRDIFERVVAGFTTVAADPGNKVRARAKAKLQNKLHENTDNLFKDNQIVLAGTAYYSFNHFAEYWRKARSYVYSRGEERVLEELLGGPTEKGFNWQDYSVIRIPVDILPDGLMDDGIIARAKATIHSGIYDMEYGSVFTSDSQGFFKRTLIESCVVDPSNPIKLPSGEVCFEAQLFGDKNKHYVYGVDPASEVDNFSIVVLEVNDDHRRIVYCWTTTRQQHKEKVKHSLVTETDFYSYCARKIRDLMKVFPCKEIAMDAQGGGIAVMEALHDHDKIKDGELPIWPIIDMDKPQDTDDNPGLHLLNMCQFGRADWLSEANHGMRKDFEDKILLFPYFDTITLGLAGEMDNATGVIYDTLEDCVMDIEELKNELSFIVITQTATGRERWDTPESRVGIGKTERLRKDRYSALLMANMSARKRVQESPYAGYCVIGGFAAKMEEEDIEEGPLYDGPAWWTENVHDLY